jgi:hypothetical protein
MVRALEGVLRDAKSSMRRFNQGNAEQVQPEGTASFLRTDYRISSVWPRPRGHATGFSGRICHCGLSCPGKLSRTKSGERQDRERTRCVLLQLSIAHLGKSP